MSRADVQDKPSSAEANPMNRLVPYLDLFGRLSDDELARLAGVPAAVAANLRSQVVQVDRALARFTDLLPRLTDAELVRLTGATPKTIRFWRLCQPRLPMAGPDGQAWSVAQAAETLGKVQSSAEVGRRPGSAGHHTAMSDEPPLDSGAPLEPRPSLAETSRHGGRLPTSETAGTSGAYRMPTAEREGGAYRLPTAEREGGASAHRMPTADREGSAASRLPTAPVDLSRPRTSRAQEAFGAAGDDPGGPSKKAAPGAVPPILPRQPELVQKQQAVAQQMTFSGAPFPGYDSEASGPRGEDDGIFIGLELPDPRTLTNPGRRD